MCETIIDPTRDLSGNDPVYNKKVKKDQQIKNRNIKVQYVTNLIEDIGAITNFETKQLSSLGKQIVDLWHEFVQKSIKKKKYTHRKDKRCFIVSITMSMRTGIKNNKNQFIVWPHEDVAIKKLNKKSKYKNFLVSDIRYGLNLIKKVFQDESIENSINLTM
jgi:hypothetical protein